MWCGQGGLRGLWRRAVREQRDEEDLEQSWEA